MEQRKRSHKQKPKTKPKASGYGKHFVYRLTGSILLIVAAVYIKENVPEVHRLAKEALDMWSFALPPLP